MTFIYEPRLYILCGLPFSGKTTLAKQLVETLRIPGIDLDVINSAKGIGREGQPISADEWDDTYTRSYQQLAAYLRQGISVVYDATNFLRTQRDRLRAIADDCGVPATVIFVDVPLEVATARWQLNRISKQRYDVRDEDFAQVIEQFEPPMDDERFLRYEQGMPRDHWIGSLLRHP